MAGSHRDGWLNVLTCVGQSRYLGWCSLSLWGSSASGALQARGERAIATMERRTSRGGEPDATGGGPVAQLERWIPP